MLKAALVAILTLIACCALALEGFSEFGPMSLDTVPPELCLLSPNGGEIWTAGRIQTIQWTAGDNHFGLTPIDLSYSLESGSPFGLGNSVANSGSFLWRLPLLHSQRVLVQLRAKDLFGNCATIESAAYFTIYHTIPRAPQGLSISLRDSCDVLLSWQAVSQNEDGSLLMPDGYLVLCSEHPDLENFQVLAVCHQTYYVDLNAGLSYPNRFYAVLAFVENDPENALLPAFKAAGNVGPWPVHREVSTELSR